jgi:hypothetical protein
MDGLTATYLVLFVAGAGFGTLSWLLGSLHGHADAGAGGDGGHAAGGHAAGDHAGGGHHGEHAHDAGSQSQGLAQRAILPLVNLSALAALACVGGGVGFLARRAGVSAPLSLAASVPSGLCAAYLVGGLLSWLKRGTRYVEPLKLEGTLATVLAPVSDTSTGEIMYLKNGTRCSLPARGRSSLLIEPGAEVIVVEVERGIAKVVPATEMLGDGRSGK